MILLAVAGKANVRYAALNFLMLPLIALTLLHVASIQKQGIAKVFINPLTIYLGDISYAFFIYQLPIMLWLDKHPGATRPLPSWLAAPLLLALNIGMAAVSHRWIEPPGSLLVKREWARLRASKRSDEVGTLSTQVQEHVAETTSELPGNRGAIG